MLKIPKYQLGSGFADPYSQPQDKYTGFFKSSMKMNTPTTLPLDFKATSLLGAQIQGSTIKSMGTKFKSSDFYGSSSTKSADGSNVTKGPSTKAMSTMKSIGGVSDAISSALPDANNNQLTNDINKGYDAAADAIMAIPGYGTIIGGAMKAGALLNKGLSALTGGATTINNASNTADKIMSSNFFALTPTGLLNSLTKKKVEGSDTQLASTISRGYSPTNALDKTEIGGVTNFVSKLFGGKNKDLVKNRQNRVDTINSQNALKSSAVYSDTQNQIASNNSMQDVASKNRQKLNGGLNTSILSASRGTKLKLERISKRVSSQAKPETDKVNVIPSGALHARKHSLPDEIADQVTHKGVPVISYDEDNKIIQHAEIEREELTLHKELSTKLENLFKQYEEANDDDKDAILIKTGKLLTYEILENTEDNVGLIEKTQ